MKRLYLNHKGDMYASNDFVAVFTLMFEVCFCKVKFGSRFCYWELRSQTNIERQFEFLRETSYWHVGKLFFNFYLVSWGRWCTFKHSAIKYEYAKYARFIFLAKMGVTGTRLQVGGNEPWIWDQTVQIIWWI